MDASFGRLHFDSRITFKKILELHRATNLLIIAFLGVASVIPRKLFFHANLIIT